VVIEAAGWVFGVKRLVLVIILSFLVFFSEESFAKALY